MTNQGLPSIEEDLSRIEDRVVAYAREAGRMALARYGTPLDISYKSKRMGNPVTAVDKEIESFLHAAIARDFPGHGILGEEGTGIGAQESDFWWVLDPLDGTTNFVNGLPLFAVSIGVLHHLEPVAGAIFAPETHWGSEGVFHAAKQRGSFLDDARLRLIAEEPSPARLISVPGNYGRSFKLDKELRKRLGEPRVLGSIALEMALTAAGVFQFAVFGAPKIWDVAAGTLLVQEAGGTVLARNRESGEWEDLPTFAAEEKDPGGLTQSLRKWTRSVLAGNPTAAGFVAQHLRLRARSAAKGHSVGGPDGEKPGSE